MILCPVLLPVDCVYFIQITTFKIYIENVIRISNISFVMLSHSRHIIYD